MTITNIEIVIAIAITIKNYLGIKTSLVEVLMISALFIFIFRNFPVLYISA